MELSPISTRHAAGRDSQMLANQIFLLNGRPERGRRVEREAPMWMWVAILYLASVAALLEAMYRAPLLEGVD